MSPTLPPRIGARWPQQSPYLVDAVGHGLKCELAGAVHGLPVVSRAPAGTVDVDQLRHVADGRGLDDVRHEWLVQHPDTCGPMWAGKHRVWSPSGAGG